MGKLVSLPYSYQLTIRVTTQSDCVQYGFNKHLCETFLQKIIARQAEDINTPTEHIKNMLKREQRSIQEGIDSKQIWGKNNKQPVLKAILFSVACEITLVIFLLHLYYCRERKKTEKMEERHRYNNNNNNNNNQIFNNKTNKKPPSFDGSNITTCSPNTSAPVRHESLHLMNHLSYRCVCFAGSSY